MGHWIMNKSRILKKSIIPNSVKSIGNGAFDGCFRLKSIVIPETVTTIGSRVFSNCPKLEQITIPKSVKSIGNGAFSNTPWLAKQQEKNPIVVINDILINGEKCKGKIKIPDTVKSICDYSFACNDTVTSLSIPDMKMAFVVLYRITWVSYGDII